MAYRHRGRSTPSRSTLSPFCVGSAMWAHPTPSINFCSSWRFLLRADRSAAFDLVAHALLEGNRRQGYQCESLGADVFTRLIGLCLADHRSLFRDESRRQLLIDCLGVFISAGWPAARRLLYACRHRRNERRQSRATWCRKFPRARFWSGPRGKRSSQSRPASACPLLGNRPMPTPSQLLPPALGFTGSATACPALFVGFVATITGSDFSRPCITGCGSSPSRCGPAARDRRPDARSPGSRTGTIRTCQGLRPRRVERAVALTRPFVWPSAVRTASAPGTTVLARLNGWPMRTPTDASPPPSRTTAHCSGPMRIATPSS